MSGKHKKCEILICCTVFVATAAFCQPLPHAELQTIGKQQLYRPFLQKTTVISRQLSPVVQPDGYARTLGFFCRQEIRMDKQTPVKLRFRLGSVAHCDYLEGKKGSNR
jgi:hypothetical protein